MCLKYFVTYLSGKTYYQIPSLIFQIQQKASKTRKALGDK